MTRGAKLSLWCLLMTSILGGCTTSPVMLKPAEQRTIDRGLIEYPAATELKPVVRGLTAPTGIAFDTDGTMILTESGAGGRTPRIFGYKPDGTYFDIYPQKQKFPFNIGGDHFTIHAPIGGVVVHEGRIFVTHRDANGYGVITSFGYDGSHYTVVSDLPAQGDYGLTDLTVNPTSGRLLFALGSATNSGVVGEDNWDAGWLRKFPNFCDQPWDTGKHNSFLKLLGYRFSTANPRAGLGQDDVLITGPMQPFGVSNQTRVKRTEKPTGAIYSISPTGGDLQVEAHGLRLPRGLRYNGFRLYATNNGMELRGTRPIKNDPDVMVRVVSGTWYGFPDYSADFLSITDPKFQPEPYMVLPTGYPDVSFTIDHDSSGLIAPERSTLLQGIFQPLSGAAKFDFVPTGGPFREFRGNAVVALSGDRSPFATSGQKLIGPIGFKIVLLDVDGKQVREFIHNTKDVPASMLEDPNSGALERPIDVKFAPDGSLYIVDFGKMEIRDGKERISAGSGKVFKLVAKPDTTNP